MNEVRTALQDRQYADQILAHLDENGKTSNNNVRDLAEMVMRLTNPNQCRDIIEAARMVCKAFSSAHALPQAEDAGHVLNAMWIELNNKLKIYDRTQAELTLAEVRSRGTTNTLERK